MRTTLNTIYSKINTNLAKITTEMGKINEQISSGMQMGKISDVPVNLVNALRFRSSIVELDQYTENIQHGNSIITAAEAALTQMKDLALRAKSLAIQATDPGYSTANRDAIAEEIKNMFDQAVYLANTQVNGKYIFGGARTEGYTDVEPTPFMVDKGDGYWINGASSRPLLRSLNGFALESATTVTDLVANDLLINGIDIGPVDLTVDLSAPADGTPDDTLGVNMAGASELKDAINLHTDLHAGVAATADPAADGKDSIFDFELNGVPITVTVPNGSNATTVANTAIAAINIKTADTGVVAVLGDGTNGGPVDSVVFKNAQADDTAPITVANFTTTQQGGADLGFSDFSQKIVRATLTTQIYGAASAGAAGGETIDFSINGVQIGYTATAGGAAVAAQEAIAYINAVSDITGVTAVLGNGANGGPANAIILKNTLAGDDSAITLTGLGIGPPDETAITGLTNGLSQAADATHNTGTISLASDNAISITTSASDDTILNRIGLGGGDIGNYDAANDGSLVYGYPLSSGDLKINGISVPALTNDGISDIFTDASAAAKANAINSISAQTGVTAVVNNTEAMAASAVDGGNDLQRATGLVTNTVIRTGDLAINGTALTTEISSGAVINGLNMGKTANAKTAINLESATTSVAGRLTTLLTNNTAATIGGITNVNFQINGVDIDLTTGGYSGFITATEVVAAVNAAKDQTGVEARVGDGTNGGVNSSVVLFNRNKGDESAIIITGINSPAEDFIGLGNNGPLGQGADATHNTGEISLDSDRSITLSSPTLSPASDVILNELGFSSQNVTGVGGATSVTSTVTGVSITAPNSLYVNGIPVGDIIGGAPVNGINMDMAASAKTQIETADPTVHVNLTTLAQGAAAAVDATLDSEITFAVNGEYVTVNYPATALASDIATATVTAINAVTAKTGVQAYVGTGAADGTPAGSAPLNAIVFKNTTPGDEKYITISGMQVSQGNNDLGFTNFSQGADSTHNTGEITISSDTTFDLSTPTVLNDAVLNRLGLGFGALAGFSEKNDGVFYATTGVGQGLTIVNASPTFLQTGDLTINGQDIFTVPTAVLQNDQDNSLMEAINAKTAITGVQATRGSDGVIRLAASDGRNIHIETSFNGEAITHLTGGTRDEVFFGSIQLRSDRKFILETVDPTVNSEEPGLASLGLAGGQTISGEPNDVAGDGKINVFSIHTQMDSVRYTGDRIMDLAIKIGKTSTMTIGENGKTGIMDTDIFSILKSLENSLRNQNFTSITGVIRATSTDVLLNSKKTGLEPATQLPTEDLFAKGSFTVTVTDHDYYPPRSTSISISVDPSVDTLASVAKRIDGIPHLSASWDSEGRLTVASGSPERYTIDLSNDSSNYLKATGVSGEFMQMHGIEQSIGDLDTLMESLSRQISGFGARANRIDIQSQIYSTMTIATKENLSEVQDTDMIKAVMDLKTKETAYQAALSAAAKTMQLSLVDYLR